MLNYFSVKLANLGIKTCYLVLKVIESELKPRIQELLVVVGQAP